MMGPGQVAQVVGALDMPRFWVQSLVRAHTRMNQLMHR